jgi:hypothetical protein
MVRATHETFWTLLWGCCLSACLGSPRNTHPDDAAPYDVEVPGAADAAEEVATEDTEAAADSAPLADADPGDSEPPSHLEDTSEDAHGTDSVEPSDSAGPPVEPPCLPRDRTDPDARVCVKDCVVEGRGFTATFGSVLSQFSVTLGGERLPLLAESTETSGVQEGCPYVSRGPAFVEHVSNGVSTRIFADGRVAVERPGGLEFQFNSRFLGANVRLVDRDNWPGVQNPLSSSLACGLFCLATDDESPRRRIVWRWPDDDAGRTCSMTQPGMAGWRFAISEGPTARALLWAGEQGCKKPLDSSSYDNPVQLTTWTELSCSQACGWLPDGNLGLQMVGLQPVSFQLPSSAPSVGLNLNIPCQSDEDCQGGVCGEGTHGLCKWTEPGRLPRIELKVDNLLVPAAEVLMQAGYPSTGIVVLVPALPRAPPSTLDTRSVQVAVLPQAP